MRDQLHETPDMILNPYRFGAGGGPTLEGDVYIQGGVNSGTNYNGVTLLLKKDAEAQFTREIILGFSGVNSSNWELTITPNATKVFSQTISVFATSGTMDETTYDWDASVLESWTSYKTGFVITDPIAGVSVMIPITGFTPAGGNLLIRLQVTSQTTTEAGVYASNTNATYPEASLVLV